MSRAAQVGGPGVAGWWGRWPAPGCSAHAARGRKEEEGEGRKGRREKKKREKAKKEKGKGKKKNGEREKERELSAGFAAAVGHARAAVFGQSATITQNERKEKGIGRRLVLVSEWRIAGKFFWEKQDLG